MRRRLLKTFSLLAFSFIAVAQVHATIDASLQMQLGNPSNATADTNNHSHYLIQRPVEALDYNDSLGQPNWASWDLTASDLGTNSRSGTFFTDTNLPPNFYRVTSADYTHSDYDRGHMCPSGDRTDTEANNDMVFLMSNIVPQNSLNNSGVWGQFETYCRTLTTSNELLIVCGPSGFGSNRINTNGPAYIPAYVWKIAVVVPTGSGTALSRITNSTRVIALKIPNSDAATNNWQAYVTSASQIEVDTGFTFFTALPNTLASVLRNKVDGQTNPPPVIFGFSPAIGAPNTNVVITGTNFASASAVTFGSVSAASFNVDSGTQISAVVPTNAGTGFLSVTTPSGTAISSNSFTIIGGGVYTGTLIGWDVSGLTGGVTNYGTSPLTPTTNAPNLTVVGLTRGSGIGTGGTAAAQAWGGVNFTNSTATTAIASNKVITFHVAANAGYKVSFSSISRFDYRRSSTGPSSGVLQYQISSGAFVDITNLSYTVTSSSGGSIGAINLSGISALQNVEVGTNIVFRIVNYGGTDSGGTWYINDVANSSAFDLAVQGTVTPVDIRPPSIVANPSSRTNLATTMATFTVGADGATPLTYAWKKTGVNLSDGGNISGATNATLTIATVLASDVANYSCYITNANGWTNTDSAALVVIDPAILTQPLNQTNILGTTAMFVSSAGGTASLTYQWQKGGTNLTDVGTVVGSSTSSLTISNVSSNDAGNYSLVVSNSLGSATSSTASLTVLIPPTITAQPVNRTNNTGTTATFTVAASGTQPISYRWKKNGVNLSDVGTVTGSTTATLTISNVQAANGGTYSVVVTNSAGSVTSSDALLEIATALGEIVLSGSSYSQNFDSMGTGTNLPSGWLMTAPGTASPTYGSSANFSNVNLTASTGSPTTGGRYNWAPTANTSDRAIGFMTSGSYASPNSIMSGFYNGTGSNIVALTVAFDIERYRINSSAASNTFFLSYDGTNWTSYTAGDSGAFSTGTSTYTFAGGTVVSKSFTLAGLSITNNGRFYLRWNLGTIGSNSQGLGLDNVVLDATLANPPLITANPSSQTVDPGTTVNFSVITTGTDPLCYRWRKGGAQLNDGGNISGSASATLTVGTAGLNDVAGYDVVITNFMGSVTSTVATLTLTNGAAINEQPISRTNISGTTVTFAVTANGANPLIYQWRKDSTDLTNGGTIFGANTDSLTVSSLTPADAGDYSVVVTNGAASALSATATLTIIVPPLIITQPVSQTVLEGTNVTLFVGVTGTAPFSYQWYFADNPLSDQTNATLSLTGVTTNHSGTYYVSISGVAGTRNSDLAVLTVLRDTVEISSQPVSRTNNVGTTATFTVVNSGSNLGYQWQKNGTNVLDGANISGATTASLTIASAAHTNEGSYAVVITNSAGSATSDLATLKVVEPYITLQPVSVSPNLSNSLTLTVAAVGSPNTTNKYQWYFKAATALPAAPFAIQAGKTNTTLFVTNVLATQAGSYYAVVTNIYGKTTSSVVVVTVITTPKLTLQPTVLPKATLPNGSLVYFSVSAFSGTAPTFQWALNGTNITGATASKYTNYAATFSDSGTYTVVASNAAGSVTNTNSLVLTIVQDTNIPTVVIHKPSALSITTSTTNPVGTVLAYGTASDNARVTNVYYRLNGSAWSPVATFVPAVDGKLAKWTNSITAAAGTNTLETYSVDYSGTNSKIAKVVFFYHVPSPLTISFDEHDTRAGEGTDSLWPPDYRATVATMLVVPPDNAPTNGANLYVNRGPYKLTAIAGHNQMFTNWTQVKNGVTNFFSTNSVITFVMETNMHLVANFVHNPWMEAAGEYTGLFTDPGLSFENSGFISLLVSTNRSFSGKLLIDGDNLPLTGAFNVDGTRNLTVSRALKGKTNLFVGLTALFGADINSGTSSGTNQVIGSLTNGAVASTIRADQWIYKGASTNPYAGKYTMILPKGEDAALSPGGYGYGLITVSTNAKPTVLGALGDSTLFTPEIAPMSLDGKWPVFKQIYLTSKLRTVNFTNDQQFHTNLSYLGTYIGWLQFTNNTDISGELKWTKILKAETNLLVLPTGVYTNYYTNGFTNTMAVTGMGYTTRSNSAPTGADMRVVVVTNVLLSFTDGNLTGTQSQAFHLNTNNSIKFITNFNQLTLTNQLGLKVTNSQLGALTVTFLNTSGKMSGTFTNAISKTPTGAAKPLLWSGAVLQQLNIGYGYFLGTNQSGAVLLQQDPGNYAP